MSLNEVRKQVENQLAILESRETKYQMVANHAVLAILNSLNQNLAGPVTFPPTIGSRSTSTSVECPKCGYVASATLK